LTYSELQGLEQTFTHNWTYKSKKAITSMPVIWTGVYLHMPIAITANSLQHWQSPSKRQPVSHTTYGLQLSSQFVAPD